VGRRLYRAMGMAPVTIVPKKLEAAQKPKIP